MKITSATSSDYPTIAELITSPEEMFLVHPNGNFPLNVNQLEEIAQMRKELTVGKIDNKVVAFADLYDVIPDNSAFIGNVIIDKAARGKGFGEQMIHHMINVCQQQYNATPHLSVFGYNARATLLYKRIGFLPYDVDARTDFKGDTVALFHMRYEKSN